MIIKESKGESERYINTNINPTLPHNLGLRLVPSWLRDFSTIIKLDNKSLRNQLYDFLSLLKDFVQ